MPENQIQVLNKHKVNIKLTQDYHKINTKLTDKLQSIKN
ncbi:hypothetical protein SBF1_2590013 [Candidatus Desulfosporosinus infrequens]|uniref:Uncharacterized protein n=1 Tax=Candidatus Desulfosporosinus infrequens TaxID=2043169 RepID=A0A2U3KQ76_9FIRM|nr:hypothetical protein SBF1_2590013 [Candidatus Desulfosporosinus infrequens]